MSLGPFQSPSKCKCLLSLAQLLLSSVYFMYFDDVFDDSENKQSKN